jgi:POT family proton-dependent oligopeptide transporter
MLCGYIGEKISLSWGFGLAGICNFGMFKFYFTQDILRYWFKTHCTLNKEFRKACRRKVPANIVRDRIIAVLIFSVFTAFARLNKLRVNDYFLLRKFTQRELFGIVLRYLKLLISIDNRTLLLLLMF